MSGTGRMSVCSRLAPFGIATGSGRIGHCRLDAGGRVGAGWSSRLPHAPRADSTVRGLRSRIACCGLSRADQSIAPGRGAIGDGGANLRMSGNQSKGGVPLDSRWAHSARPDVGAEDEWAAGAHGGAHPDDGAQDDETHE